MTDIIHELRQRDGDWVCEKAADEIERLTAECEAWRECAQLNADRYTKAASEIERLRAKLTEAVSCLERGAYDLRQGGYLRSATILEECAVEVKP